MELDNSQATEIFGKQENGSKDKGYSFSRQFENGPKELERRFLCFKLSVKLHLHVSMTFLSVYLSALFTVNNDFWTFFGTILFHCKCAAHPNIEKVKKWFGWDEKEVALFFMALTFL